MNKRKTWLRFPILAVLALSSLLIAEPSIAADYVGSCAAVPSSVTGNATIGTPGTACTIPAAGVNATGDITINGSTVSTTGNLTAGGAFNLNASSTVNIKNVSTPSNNLVINGGGNVTTTALSAGANIKAVSSSGILFLNGTVTSNTNGLGGNILLKAGSNVRVGAISTSGGTKTGGVQIDANTSGGNTLFTIGNNGTNGVTSINTSNTSGGGTSPTFIVGGVRITNGNAASTGGITVTSMSVVNVLASASRSGSIMLNAQNGTLTLPTGKLNAEGTATSGAGQIFLLGNQITTVNGTIVSASQPSTMSGTSHSVIISANTVAVAGGTGLNVTADGDGYSSGSAFVALVPKSAFSTSSNDDFANLAWTPTTIALNSPETVTVTGGSAPFKASANGNNTQVLVSGKTVTFANGPVNLTAKGSIFGGHNIYVQYSGAFTNANGLTFSGNGAVVLDTSGNTGNDSAGHIYVYVDQASINSTVPALTINASGSGTGSGGTITYQPTKAVALASPTINMSANGPFGYINFVPRVNSTTVGDSSITATTFNLNANGPTSGTGNAGTIFFNSANTTIGAATKMKFSAIGPTSGTGNGGNVTVFPGSVAGGTLKLGTNAGNLQVIANAGSTGGDGGTVNINPYPAPNGNISIETVNAVTASASTGASANSKGGSITLIGNPNVTVLSTLNGASLNVDGKGTKDGGTIKILGNGTLNLGTAQGGLNLSAKANGTGKGGNVEVGYTSTLTQDGEISVSGGNGSSSNGQGGTISLHHLGAVTISGQLKADGAGTGKAGTININSSAFNTMNLNNAVMSSSGDVAGSGEGNNIIIANAGTVTVNNSLFKANGGGSGGNAGGISINIDPGSTAINVTTAKFEAKGTANGQGGRVDINKATGTLTPSDPTVAINVQYVINVDGGTGIGISDFDGSITLNGVTCQQWKTVAAVFPKVGWDCITPSTGANISTLVSAGASFSPTIQGHLENLVSPPPAAQRVGVYAMNSLRNFESFFGRPAGGGYNFQYGRSLISWLRVSATFASSDNGANTTLSGSSTIMVSALVHELGHNLDYIWGPGLGVLSDQTAWSGQVAPAFATMDGLSCTSVFFAATCSANPGKTNTQIFNIQFPGIKQDRNELFAAMYEHVQSFLTGNPPSYQVEPELEKALDSLTLLKSAMSNIIANPPTPVK